MCPAWAGGLELTLACHGRIASPSPSSVIVAQPWARLPFGVAHTSFGGYLGKQDRLRCSVNTEKVDAREPVPSA